jgi:hypothetical protein
MIIYALIIIPTVLVFYFTGKTLPAKGNAEITVKNIFIWLIIIGMLAPFLILIG